MVAECDSLTIVESDALKNQQRAAPEADLTPIQRFYDGAGVLVTGGTGFLGKILVEKLLRSCPTVAALYLIIRNKKGKRMEQRLNELFDDAVFDKMKKECPKYVHKVVGVAGDCSLPDLGLSMQDKRLLVDEVSVVFHVAATVSFDESIRTATAINVRSLRDLLDLSKRMINLKAFMHVSTAYSNCTKAVIEERVYPPPIEGAKLILMTENLPDRILDEIAPSLLGDYPNTYTFTKQVAENIANREGPNLPVGIFRPAIVVSTYREPLVAWISNLYGPTGVCAGAGTGVLRTLHCDARTNANLVPVDMCVNSLIASAWEVAENYQEAVREKRQHDVLVYNYESSNDNPLDWGTFMHYSSKYGIHYPTNKAVWFYSLDLYKNYVHYLIATFFFHTLPAAVADLILMCIGKKPRALKIYKKVHKFSSVISYFSTRNWRFDSAAVRRLLDKMAERDKQIFFCDLKKLNWVEFYEFYLRGVRVYLLKDPISTLPEAKRKWVKLYWAHQITKGVVILLALRIGWTLLKFLRLI